MLMPAKLVRVDFDLRAARATLGWSQSRTAREAGVTTGTVARLERRGEGQHRMVAAVSAALSWGGWRRSTTRR